MISPFRNPPFVVSHPTYPPIWRPHSTAIALCGGSSLRPGPLQAGDEAICPCLAENSFRKQLIEDCRRQHVAQEKTTAAPTCSVQPEYLPWALCEGAVTHLQQNTRLLYGVESLCCVRASVKNGRRPPVFVRRSPCLSDDFVQPRRHSRVARKYIAHQTLTHAFAPINLCPRLLPCLVNMLGCAVPFTGDGTGRHLQDEASYGSRLVRGNARLIICVSR